jgi:NADH-quinone oxidoreductase subunit H
VSLETLFIDLKQWILSWGLWPESFTPIVSMVLSISPILAIFGLLFGLTTVIERKALGRIQNRRGPNRVGPCGMFQFVADGIKMLTKEDIVPRTADRVIHFIAPLTLLIPVFLAYAVLPFGRGMTPINLEAGLLFFFAIGAATELAVFMAGWSSRNKYSLIGAMRAIAQMISYELPLVISALGVVMIVGSLSLVSIVEAQGFVFGWLPGWHVFTPWGLAGFILFMIAATAESNRTPFDLPEAESEIIAGYLTEYSGFKYALFFLGEYLGLFAISGLAITLFLGGWQAPFPFLEFIPSWAWFFLKLFAFLGVFIWLRGTLPRLRMDQLMQYAWKFLLPLSLVNILVVALWHFTAVWEFPGAFLVRWILCLGLIAVPFVILGKALGGPERPKRVYRYAT